MSKKTAVFILSSMHSGSTWVGYVLGSAQESAFVGEYYRAWNEAIRVPCTVCAAKGLPACEVLHDVEKARADSAMELAAQRTGKRVIADSSKVIDLIKVFDEQAGWKKRVILIVKDQRGYYESSKRRGSGDVTETMTRWVKENQAFRDYLVNSGLRSVTVSYDLLAQSPISRCRQLFKFCGMTFSREALAYWRVEHHGFAANGATDAPLKNSAFENVPAHFATGDNSFYSKNSKTLFRDERWRPPPVLTRASGDQAKH
jgi:LPS sulfotransferase NodH